MSGRSVTAIVLAGGRSSRFGRPKLEARIGDDTVLARTIAAVSTVADGVIVAGTASPADPYPSQVPVAFVRDPRPYEGPLAAVAAVLGTFVPGGTTSEPPADDLAIVVGGDMPALVPRVLSLLLDRLAETPALDAMTLARPAPPDEPAGRVSRATLPLVLRIVPAAAAASAAIDAGDRALFRLLDRLRSGELASADWRTLDPEGRTLLDIDLPADLDRLRGLAQ